MFSLLYSYSKSEGVLCFHYSRMRIVNDTYHVRTHVRMYLRLQHYVSALRCRDKKKILLGYYSCDSYCTLVNFTGLPLNILPALN